MTVPFTLRSCYYTTIYTRYSTVIYTRYSTVIYTRYSTVIYTSYSTVIYTRYSTVIYTRYSTVIYTRYSTVIYTRYSTVIYTIYSTVIYTRYSTVIYTRYSTVFRQQFTGSQNLYPSLHFGGKTEMISGICHQNLDTLSPVKYVWTLQEIRTSSYKPTLTAWFHIFKKVAHACLTPAYNNNQYQTGHMEPMDACAL